jgi:phosphoglycerate dehydrogenase-like enzyme
MHAHHTVAIFAAADNPALTAQPTDLPDGIRFVVGNTLKALSEQGGEDAEAMLVLFPYSSADVEALSTEIYPAMKQLKWVHSFSAGVDALAPFIQERLVKDNHVAMTCGRSAFSSSLGEYVMAAALHFNKQVPRCLENTKTGRWID